jgi:hypothetical protein
MMAAWVLEWLFLEPALRNRGWSLNWFDTDWLGALVAFIATCGYIVVRRRIDEAAGLALCMTIGWYVSFLALVVGLNWRMTPPRGDNWAGCLGMVAGILVYSAIYKRSAVAWATLVVGAIGGISFAGATMLKLVEVTSGLQSNWHSVLEQTIGLINGIGVAYALWRLAKWQPVLADDAEPHTRGWDIFAAFFTVMVISYVNLHKNPERWVSSGQFPGLMLGLKADQWFEIAYVSLSISFVVPLIIHRRRPVEAIPSSWVGRGQVLFLLLMWGMVVGNFERALIGFREQRLVTEGVITLNAACLTLLVLLGSARPRDRMAPPIEPNWRSLLPRTAALAMLAMVAAAMVDFGVVRAIYGERFAGHAGYHLRFGDPATRPVVK